MAESARYHRWTHGIALALALIVFPLIWVGGLVTTFDAGMAVPDWPNTYGYNLFLYPLRDWFFGPWDLFVEHGHRLLGSLAGLSSIALVIVAFAVDRRRWFCWLTVLALALVIAQGALGGARVVLDERALAMIHGCVGPMFFALAVALCVACSKWWFRAPQRARTTTGSLGWLSSLAQWIVLASYLQLVIGANMRHVDLGADPLFYRTLVLAHLIVAGSIVGLAIAIAVNAGGAGRRATGLRWVSAALLSGVCLQVVLGLSTWVIKFGWPAWFDRQSFAASYVIAEKSFLQMNVVTAHVAVGSLILGVSTLLAVRCRRLATARQYSEPHSTGPSRRSIGASAT